MASTSPTGESAALQQSPPSSHKSGKSSIAEVLAALDVAALAQQRAYYESTGAEALAAHQALSETLSLKKEIQERYKDDLTAVLRQDEIMIPPSVPGWLPGAIARRFGQKTTVKDAVIEIAQANTQFPTSFTAYPSLEPTPPSMATQLVGRLKAIVGSGTGDAPEAIRDKKKTPSDNGSVASAISQKRAELLRVREQRLQAELEQLEQQQADEQNLDGFEDPKTPDARQTAAPRSRPPTPGELPRVPPIPGIGGDPSLSGATLDGRDFFDVLAAESAAGQSQTTGSWVKIPQPADLLATHGADGLQQSSGSLVRQQPTARPPLQGIPETTEHYRISTPRATSPLIPDAVTGLREMVDEYGGLADVFPNPTSSSSGILLTENDNSFKASGILLKGHSARLDAGGLTRSSNSRLNDGLASHEDADNKTQQDLIDFTAQSFDASKAGHASGPMSAPFVLAPPPGLPSPMQQNVLWSSAVPGTQYSTISSRL